MLLVIAGSLLYLSGNSSNDSSSVIAPIIASKAASPRQAVILAAVCEFMGALAAYGGVGKTVSGLLQNNTSAVMGDVVAAALVSAVIWNYLAARIGMPASSTHALIGALTGCMIYACGLRSVNWGIIALSNYRLDGLTKIFAGLLLAPLLGGSVAYCVQKLSVLLLASANIILKKRMDKAQWVLSGLLAYNLGVNDSQKVIGLVVLLAAIGNNNGYDNLNGVSMWLMLLIAIAMGSGALAGGWKIVKTLGNDICSMNTLHSYNSELSSITILVAANLFGMPVSPSQVIAGSVIGVGCAENRKGVNWVTGIEIGASWLVTIPANAILGVLFYMLFSMM